MIRCRPTLRLQIVMDSSRRSTTSTSSLSFALTADKGRILTVVSLQLV